MPDRILIIEDDADIANIERDFLEINGFEVSHENNGAKGIEKALAGNFSLVLLDLMLPDKNGYEICKAIRAHTDIPSLRVTAQDGDGEKVRGFGLGADDYIVKPFSPVELVARVQAHIARFNRLTGKSSIKNSENKEIVTGNLTVNHTTRRVFVSGNEIELANKEYELLHFLISNPEMVFSHEQIYDKIWGKDMCGELETVTVHINRLRKKINQHDPAQAGYIQTVRGAGYRFSHKLKIS
jgi:DNA-binding response OmpR family regulator